MIAEGMKKDIRERMAFCVEKGCTDTTVRVHLSNDKQIDIWYFEEQDCFVWSHSTLGYDDSDELVSDLAKWLEENGLDAVRVESI